MTKSSPFAVVWFKRDLRVSDHAALAAAAETGLPVLPLYIAEPELWQQPDASARQWAFIAETLESFRTDLAALGQPLIVRVGDAVQLFKRLHGQHGIAHLFAHEETGNDWTFSRDKRVIAWAREASVPFTEFQGNGVIRRLKNRDGWARAWDRRMAQDQIAAPQLQPIYGVEPGAIPTAPELGLAADRCPGRQLGGRQQALARFGAFLSVDGQPYRRAMSSPSLGAVHCSRLSPHLAFGVLSMREAAQGAWARMRDLREDEAHPNRTEWRGSMVSFAGRLYWRDHFIQKLEDEPAVEWRAFHPAYRGQEDFTPETAQRVNAGRIGQNGVAEDTPYAIPDPRISLQAWMAGETGLPFVDACMRSLQQTGWLNFRMRAMLVSCASNLLGIPWRPSGQHLARLFTDYEPGIHWSQMQMQSGTTGINTVRIYNPIKQGLEHDADGAFVKHFVPELADVPAAFIHEPWRWEQAGSLLGKTYPEPLIDVQQAMRAARLRIHGPRKAKSFRQASDTIQAKHGSRRAGLPMTGANNMRGSSTARGAAKARVTSAKLVASTTPDLFD
jgi:deoxyribodipyrimidine photo-lyase